MNELDKITQLNATSSQELLTASEQLSIQASQQSDQMSFFTLENLIAPSSPLSIAPKKVQEIRPIAISNTAQTDDDFTGINLRDFDKF